MTDIVFVHNYYLDDRKMKRGWMIILLGITCALLMCYVLAVSIDLSYKVEKIQRSTTTQRALIDIYRYDVQSLANKVDVNNKEIRKRIDNIESKLAELARKLD